MPFNPINFANIAPQGNPAFRDLVDNLASGYKAGQLPAQMARQRQQEEIANAMQKLLLEEQPQKFGEESQGRQLTNALSKFKVQEEPKRFGSEMSNAAMERALHQANINRLNTMTPLDAMRQSLENQWYPKLSQSKIDEAQSLSDYRKTAGTGSAAGGKYERDFQNFVAKDNPHITPEQIYEASNVLREGGDTLEDGTKLNPLSAAAQGALDRVLKSGTTPTVTANKKVVQAIDNVVPLITKLKEMEAPGQFIGKYFSPNHQAQYESKVAEIKDSLASALKLPGTNEGIKVIETIVGKHPFETDSSYHKRLTELEADLTNRRAKATAPQKTSSFSSGTVEEEGSIDGKPVFKKDGKWHYK